MTANEATRTQSGVLRAVASANLAIKCFLELYALARRLPTRIRIQLELVIFALACVAGYAARAVIPAIAFAIIGLGNALAMTLLHQWEG